MDIQKIRAAFALLDYDVSQDTDEDVVKLYNDSYIGAWAQLLMEAVDEAQPVIRMYDPDTAKKSGEAIRNIMGKAAQAYKTAKEKGITAEEAAGEIMSRKEE